MRVAVCQPWLGHYRTALYDLLGAQPGIDLTVFAPFAKPPECAPGPGASWKYVEEPFGGVRIGRNVARWQRAMTRAVRGRSDPARFDLVILPWDVSFPSAWAAAFKAKFVRTPLVLWGHGYSLHGGGARDVVRNLLGRRADALMVYTDTQRAALVERFGYAPERVFVARNALDQRPIRAARERWRSRPEELRAFQREKGIDPAQTIIHVSRLVQEKRPAPLVRGLALVRSMHPGARLVFVGDGPRREELERLAAELGVRDAVTFAGPIYDEMRLAPWMLSATLMCYPVNAGLSLMHAFGYGLPVVTGDRVGAHNPEIEALIDGETGMFFPVAGSPEAEDDPRSVEAMAARWRTVMGDGALRARLGAGAERAVREAYTIENMARGFQRCFSIVDGVERELAIPPGWGAGSD